VNQLREYFIGDYLRQSPDVLRQATIRLVYNIVIVSLLALAVFFSIYVVKGFHYQLVKGLVIIGLFGTLLFYLKYKKNVTPVCHLLILISWANNTINIYLFNDYSFFIALLTVSNIIFAFHTLGSRWGLIYSILHFLPVSTHFILKGIGVNIRSTPPQQMAFIEGLITLVLIFLIIVYLIYHYHKAYELAQKSLEQSIVELKRAREVADEMTRLKTNFLSNMSHEIRTPINGILGISQVIEIETKDEQIKKYVAIQQLSGRRLLNTISSILELSRLEAEQSNLKLKVIDVNTLVHDEMKSLEPLARNKHLKFSFAPSLLPLICLADENLMRQVIHNVVVNGIKFTDRGGVAITTDFTESRDYFVIEVTDTGLGISEEFLPRIFNPFEQESTGRSRTYEGTGLGLSIAKKYIELLGGQIRVISEKSKGSTFRIILPVHNTEIKKI
jgi:signal transduction histidine kinase